MGNHESPNSNFTDAIEVIGELKGRLKNDREALALLKKLEKSCRLFFNEQSQNTSPPESQEKLNQYRYEIVRLLMKLAQLVEHHWEDTKELAKTIVDYFT